MDILFCTSPIGLGHATRDAAIAENLVDLSIRFVTGGGAADLLGAYGFDTVSMYDPPSFDVRNGALYGKLVWLLRYYGYYQRSKGVISEMIRLTRPKIVVSDEDFASLYIAQERSIPTVLITDILKTRFLGRVGGMIERGMNHSMCKIVARCDAVIMPEDGDDDGAIRRVGPIVRRVRHTRNELRCRFGFDRRTILVSVGGTDAGRFLIERMVEIIDRLEPEHKVVLVSGPSMREEFAGRIHDMGFAHNLHELILASDLVVSLAGRSTIDEAHVYGTPGIFIPIKGHFEQEANALAEGFSYEDIDRLYDLVMERIGTRTRHTRTEGASRASDIIRNLLDRNGRMAS